MHIGMIGGIGPAATALYYRALVRRAAEEGIRLETTIVHAQNKGLLANFHAKSFEVQAEVYRELTARLAAAGAECVAITSIGGHFCIDAFLAVSPLPVVNLLDAVPERIAALGHRRPGLLGTNTVMETGMYGALAALGLDPMGPPADRIPDVHTAYTDMATAGAATADQRALFFAEGRAMMERGADVIVLAGTDLFEAFDGHDPGFPVVDAALLHVEALVQAARA